jgi:hypothetical protein
LRGDLEMDIQVTIPTQHNAKELLASFSDTFQAERPQIGFAGDGAGNWTGSARLRHYGDIAGVRSRLEVWARSSLPPDGIFRIRRMGRRAAW